MLTDLELCCTCLQTASASFGVSLPWVFPGAKGDDGLDQRDFSTSFLLLPTLPRHPATPVPLTQPDASASHTSLTSKPQRWEAELTRA